MRIALLLALALLLAGCGGSQLYTQQDMTQVRSVYAEILPTYVRFELAYKADDVPHILALYAREQRQCKGADQIDRRDSIDPGINLFQASATLDGMCNTIESAYAWWAKTHHRPYNIDLVPDTAATLFVGMLPSINRLPLQLEHPDMLA